jgi:ubiquitin carboxyl-terminal hydrolase 10
VLIEVLPPVLVLHLKRFVYNAAANDVVKIGKPIQFSPELEIPLGTDFLLTVNPCSETTTENSFRPGGTDVMAPTAGQPSFPARYTLYGVLYHEGTSASGGHYTVNVLHPNAHNGGGGAWLHVDDETVRTVRHEDVFGRHGEERTDDRCAYMLFYRHATSTQT